MEDQLFESLLKSMGMGGVAVFISLVHYGWFAFEDIHKGVPITGVILSIFIFLMLCLIESIDKNKKKTAEVIIKVSTLLVFIGTVIIGYFMFKSCSSIAWGIIYCVLIQIITLTFKVGMTDGFAKEEEQEEAGERNKEQGVQE